MVKVVHHHNPYVYVGNKVSIVSDKRLEEEVQKLVIKT